LTNFEGILKIGLLSGEREKGGKSALGSFAQKLGRCCFRCIPQKSKQGYPAAHIVIMRGYQFFTTKAWFLVKSSRKGVRAKKHTTPIFKFLHEKPYKGQVIVREGYWIEKPSDLPDFFRPILFQI